MTVRDMLTALQTLPRDAELLAFEAGCEDYCEREVDEVEWQGGGVYLHLVVRREDPPRGRPQCTKPLQRLGGGAVEVGQGLGPGVLAHLGAGFAGVLVAVLEVDSAVL